MACADILHFLLSAGHALQFFQHGWVGFLESRADSFFGCSSFDNFVCDSE
jgi:hypothetical protein